MSDAKRQRLDGPSGEEIEFFIMSNNLDERAIKEFRTESGTIQRIVLEKGDLSMCNNPSSAVVGRIRDAKKELATGRDMMAINTDACPPEVNNFINANRLDDRAARELRCSESAIQLKVLDKGLDLSMCPNPSATVIGRIRDAKREVAGGGVGTSQGNQGNFGRSQSQATGMPQGGLGQMGMPMGGMMQQPQQQQQLQLQQQQVLQQQPRYSSATGCAKTDLFNVLQHRLGRPLGRQDVMHGVHQNLGLFQVTLTLPCVGNPSYVGEPGATQLDAERNACVEALKDFGEIPAMTQPMGLMQPLGQGNFKADLVAFLQHKCGRPIGTTDVGYGLITHNGMYQSTITLHCFQNLQFAGEVADNGAQSEHNAAQVALNEFGAEYQQFLQSQRR